MSFDIARAVTETFGSRTPLLDRILSYLYFADVTVVEQSTADAWGIGVTVIGLKGQAESGPGVVLAGALPTLRVFPQVPSALPDAGGHPRDLVRLVDLLARVLAMSVLDPDALGARLALVAYRPDPVAAGLRDLSSSFASGMDWLLSAPVGLEPKPLSSDVVFTEVHLSGGPRQRPRRRVRNVVSARAQTPRYDPAFPLRVLWDLRGLVDRGHVEVLDLDPCAGSDLLAPCRVDVVLGVIREPPELPDPWRTLADTRPTVRIGSWSEVIGTVLDLSVALGGEVTAAWNGAGLAPPEPPIRLVALRGSSDDCSAFFAADVPRLDPRGHERVRERLEGVVASFQASTHGVAPRHSLVEGPVLPGAGRVFAMGPFEDRVLEDPAAAARLAAEAYVEALSRLVRER